MEYGSWDHITHCLFSGAMLAPLVIALIWAPLQLLVNVYKYFKGSDR